MLKILEDCLEALTEKKIKMNVRLNILAERKSVKYNVVDIIIMNYMIFNTIILE